MSYDPESLNVTADQAPGRFDGVAIAEEIADGVALLLQARAGDRAYVEQVRASFGEARNVLANVSDAEAVRAVFDRVLNGLD